MMNPPAIRQSQRYVSPPKREDFNHKVWALVRQIPPGKVCTYGQIAAMIGPPSAMDPKSYLAFGARWVGGAMAACPDGVPWQRVINSQGKVSLRPMGGGIDQRELLEAEGVIFDDHGRVDLKTYAWTGQASGFAPVHHGQLYYEISGFGKPVLLIHAGVADCSMWDEQFKLFSQQYRVIRYDARGFGKSRTEDTTFSNRQDILDLFSHLGIEKACLIGISRGGQIAVDFTLEHPECVTALIPVAAGLSGFEFDPGDDEVIKKEYALFSHMDELLEQKAYDELADLEAHAWADGPSQPVGRASAELRDYIRRTVRTNYTRQDGKAEAQPLDPPAARRLNEITVPTLIMIGEYDEIVTQAMADKLAADIPGATKVVFPATAHMIPMEQPARFNQLVLEFLGKEL